MRWRFFSPIIRRRNAAPKLHRGVRLSPLECLCVSLGRAVAPSVLEATTVLRHRVRCAHLYTNHAVGSRINPAYRVIIVPAAAASRISRARPVDRISITCIVARPVWHCVGGDARTLTDDGPIRSSRAVICRRINPCVSASGSIPRRRIAFTWDARRRWLYRRTRLALLPYPSGAIPAWRGRLNSPTWAAWRRRDITRVVPSCSCPDWSTSESVCASRLWCGALIPHTELLPRVTSVTTWCNRHADRLINVSGVSAVPHTDGARDSEHRTRKPGVSHFFPY
jgi:hypothetical protein